MPALTVYKRRWYTTSDMLPLPAALFAIIALVWLIVFGILISRLDVWISCRGEGQHFIVATAGLVAIYGLTLLFTCGMVLVGSRGSCFEISKRQGVVPLLYAQSGVWTLQAILMVYGTVIMYAVEPSCWNKPNSHRSMKELTHAMIYSTWGLIIFTIVLVWLVYNSFEGQDNLRAWEQRLKRASYFLRCHEALSTPMDDKEAALPSIAQWISGLFASVDLSPTDLTEAIILTAAAQSMRRKMRIKRALAPAVGSLSSASMSDASSDTTSMASLDDMASSMPDEGEDTDTSEDEATFALKQRRTIRHTSGELRTDPSSNSQSPTMIAVPEDYPKDWSNMAQEAYSKTAEKLEARESEQRESLSTSPRTPAITEQARGLDKRRLSDGSTRRTSNEALTARRVSAQESEMTSAFAESSMQSVAGSEGERRLEGSSSSENRPSLEARSEASGGSAESVVSLSQVDNGMLTEFNQAASLAKEDQPSPKERFGIGQKGRTKFRKGSEGLQERDSAKGVDDSSRESKEAAKMSSSKRHPHKKGNTNLPFRLVGKFQAGLEEPEGGLPPAETGTLSPALTFESSIPHTGARTSLDVAASLAAEEDLEAEVVISSHSGTQEDVVVPLEPRSENRLPPLLTPSEQVGQTIGNAVPVHEALKEAVGERASVDYEVIEEAGNWARFASAVYAVMPFTQQGYKRVCCHKPVTEESVRDAVVELAGIEEEDLLYFSHSNTALAHLPYMVALDRKNKAVVVAIRGTMSLADLVTDAVVHPESLAEWLPAATRKVKRKAAGGEKKAYGHAGITSAAKAVLEDLEVHGILHTLLQPERTRRKSAEYLTSLRRNVEGRSAPHGGHASYAHNMQNGTAEAKPTQVQEGGLQKDVDGPQSGAVWPSESFQPGKGLAERGTGKSPTRSQRDDMASAARKPEQSSQEKGEATGEALQKNLDFKGWKLVITGHSLGAGAAALIGLRIHDRYPDLKVWAFSPPGGLISRGLVGFTEQWCTSVVVGKDVVPRMSVNNLSRLMDEMVTSLARCRYHKLHVLFGGWWRKESRPPPQRLFHSSRHIPQECRITLERYHKSTARKGRAKDMFPPGRVLFVRPLKTLVKSERRGEEKKMKQAWDVVWVTSQELLAEGILVSKKMLAHHSIEHALLDALGYAMRHHPDNPKPAEERQRQEQEEEEVKAELHEVKVENEGRGPMDLLASAPST